jgi:adenosylhomocysteine nucleosidase
MNTVLAAVGLAKEAKIAKRAGLVPVIGGGNPQLLVRRLVRAAPGARAVISFGIAGSLAPLLQVGDTVVATHVVTSDEHFVCDQEWSRALRTRLTQAHSVVVAGVDSPVGHLATKQTLFRVTGAHAVDMESHIAARFAQKHGLPFVALRVISDDSHRALPPAALGPLKSNGKARPMAVLKSVMTEPDQIGELIQTARDAGTAFRALLRCCNVLGAGLGCPYLG